MHNMTNKWIFLLLGQISFLPNFKRFQVWDKNEARPPRGGSVNTNTHWQEDKDDTEVDDEEVLYEEEDNKEVVNKEEDD